MSQPDWTSTQQALRELLRLRLLEGGKSLGEHQSLDRNEAHQYCASQVTEHNSPTCPTRMYFQSKSCLLEHCLMLGHFSMSHPESRDSANNHSGSDYEGIHVNQDGIPMGSNYYEMSIGSLVCLPRTERDSVARVLDGSGSRLERLRRGGSKPCVSNQNRLKCFAVLSSLTQLRPSKAIYDSDITDKYHNTC